MKNENNSTEPETTDETMLFKVDEVQTVPAEMGFTVE